MGWANRITLARAGLTLAVWLLIVVGTLRAQAAYCTVAFWTFVLAAATDALDGILARRFAQESIFGRIADPLVDKMLILGTAAVLLGVEGMGAHLPGWALALMVTREMMVTTVRAAIEARGIDFRAVGLGKTKMVLQCVGVGACVLVAAGAPIALQVPAPDLVPWSLALWLVLAATFVTVLSGVTYAVRARQALTRR